jgi:hypothetical protein
MSDQDTEQASDEKRNDDRNDEAEGSPIPDPEDEQGDVDDVPEAD